MRARARVLAGGALAALAIAGCTSAGSSNSSVTATGDTLSIWLSVPPGAASDPAQQDVIDAERLAFQRNHGEVKDFKVRLRTAAGAELSDNARTAIQDTSAIAYIGELAPGSSEGTVGITNALDLLQVSPTDTALELTTSTPAVVGAPSKYYESWSTYGRTFARVVPDTAREAAADVAEMAAVHATSVYAGDDGSAYGAALAAAVVKDAPVHSLTVSRSLAGAGAVFYGSASPAAAARWFAKAAQADPDGRLFGPSALSSPAFAAALPAAAASRMYVSTPGFGASALPPAAVSEFVQPFVAAYHHQPAAEAIFGYEAVAAVLHVLAEAGAGASDRATVVHDFLALKDRASVLGTYSIDAAGDTSLASFVFERVRSGALVQVKSGP
jgi:branched-chain amino acid transport system substrate-binding protein